MRRQFIRSALAGLVVVSALAVAPAAFAQSVTYKATLTAAAQVPPVTDSKGTGTLTATYDPATKKLTYTADYKDLTGPAVAAHFHGPADAKSNAGIVVPVTGALTSPIKGEATWQANCWQQAHLPGASSNGSLAAPLWGIVNA